MMYKNKKKKIKILLFIKKNPKILKKTISFFDKKKFDLKIVLSNENYEKLPKSCFNWKGDYIISFKSYFIIPGKILSNAKIASINFHPGPSIHPGRGCASWALYKNDKIFGVTAHLMNKKIDSGRIFDFKNFKILKSDNIETLIKKADENLFKLLKHTIKNISINDRYIIDQCEINKKIKWVGIAKKIKEIKKLQQINTKITKGELIKIIRSTKTINFSPYIKLHGYKFYMK